MSAELKVREMHRYNMMLLIAIRALNKISALDAQIVSPVNAHRIAQDALNEIRDYPR